MSEIKLNGRHCLAENLGGYGGRTFSSKTEIILLSDAIIDM